ncbi:MAG: ATP-binding protein [Clostridia bacterium]|nr:ATP-binding protein [Clostridia bacterium]
MEKYYPRIADKVLESALARIGAVVVYGPRWCGKTTTVGQMTKSEICFDDPQHAEDCRIAASTCADILLEGETPRLIDEWQEIPAIWDVVRHEVDNRDRYGQFVLAGSVKPRDTSQIFHSGVGRIIKVGMGTMTLYESGESTGEVSLSSLFEKDPAVRAVNRLTVKDLAYLVCRGGWPKTVGEPESEALKDVKDYLAVLAESDMSRADNVGRNPDRAGSLLRSYSRHVGTQAKNTLIYRDVVTNEASALSANSVISYIEALKKLFVVNEIPAWNPHTRSGAVVRTANTRNFCDPSIATASLNIAPDTLLSDFRTFVRLFKSLCLRDLSVYAHRMDADVYHYKDSYNTECDAVIQTRDGRWGAVEIRLGCGEQVNEATANLLKFKSIIDTKDIPSPSFLMVLSGTAQYGYKREDGVFVVPVGCLKY